MRPRQNFDRWSLLLEQFGQDLGGAFRMLRKNPGFAAMTIAIIALGIGATTAVYSIVNCVVLRPLPYPQPEQLVMINEVYAPKSMHQSTSPGAVAEWRKQSTCFSSLVSDWYWAANLTWGENVTRHGGRMVSRDYFSTYGVRPILGRDFLPEEYAAGKANVVILNYKLWVRHFNADPAIINRRIRINEESYTIVGVLPKLFMSDPTTDPGLFRPMVEYAGSDTDFRGRFVITVIGRLKPEATIASAAAELNVINEQLALQYPATRKDWRAEVTPLLETKIGSIRPFLYLLLGAVGLLLLIACVNVANLLLARATSRSKELAVRIALGASRARIVRQLLVESVLLSLLGATLGILIAFANLHGLLAMAPMELPRSQEIAIDGQVLTFSVIVALLTGLGFGVVPALRASRTNLAESMKAGGRSGADDVGGNRLRSFLVASEIALALVLLTAAGLLMNSFIRLQDTPLGFEMGNTKVAKMFLLPKRYPSAEKYRLVVHQICDRLGAVPGVHSVAIADSAPGWGRYVQPVQIAGQPSDNAENGILVGFDPVTPDYFRVMGLKLIQGRLLDAHDNEKSAPVVIVSEEFARQYFPIGNALGQKIKVGIGTASPWSEIVGIVPTVREAGPALSTPFQVYTPFDQRPSGGFNLFIRTIANSSEVDRALRTALNSIDPDLPLPHSNDEVRRFYDNLIAPQRFSLFLFGVFSASALILSAMGTYGVVSYSVAQRTREIGIRVAIGAQASDIRRLVFSRAGKMIGSGLVVGLGAAMATTHLLRSLLYEVTAHDPLTLAGVVGVLAGTALLACWVPAIRATKVDPIVALRAD